MLLLALIMYLYWDSNTIRSGVQCDYDLYTFEFNVTPWCYMRKYCIYRAFPSSGEYYDYVCESVIKRTTYNPNKTYIFQIETCQGTQYLECYNGRKVVPDRTPLPTRTPYPTCTPKPLPTKTPRPINSLVCITPQPYKAKPVPAAIALYQFLFE